MNYKDDDSFFTTVFPPFVYHGWSVKSWLLENETAKYRYIRDYEIEQEFWNIEQINEVYEGIKTIAIVVNPWARIHYAYQQLREMLNNPYDKDYLNLKYLELENFTKFVESFPLLPSKIDNFWFSITTPICKWIDYEIDGETKTVDYILKDTTFEKDFKQIQEYFCSDTPLDMRTKLPDYRDFYDKKTRDIVAKIFKEDIDRFGYKF